MNLSTEKKQTHVPGEQTCGCQGRGGGGWMDWKFGVNRGKLWHLEWINNDILLYSIRNYISNHLRWNMYSYMYNCVTAIQQKLIEHIYYNNFN